MKKIIALLMCALTLVTLSSCNNITDEVFEKDGITITLTSEFIERSYENYYVSYDSKNIAVFVIKEPFSALKGLENYTLSEYAELMKLNCTKDGNLPNDVAVIDGVTYFEYSFFNKDGTSYKYFTAMYKGDDAFWTVQFASPLSGYEGFRAQIVEFAKSVKVTK